MTQTKVNFFSSENSVLQNSIGNTEATLISLLRSCWTLKRCKTKIVESPKHDYQINAFQNMKKMQNRKHFLQGRISSSNWSTAHPRTKKNRQMEMIFLTGFWAANPCLISLSKVVSRSYYRPLLRNKSPKNQVFLTLTLLPPLPPNILSQSFPCCKKYSEKHALCFKAIYF